MLLVTYLAEKNSEKTWDFLPKNSFFLSMFFLLGNCSWFCGRDIPLENASWYRCSGSADICLDKILHKNLEFNKNIVWIFNIC